MHAPVPVPRRRAARAASVLLVATAALSACSSEQLDVEGFMPGTCTDVAPVLQDLDQTLREVGNEDITPAEAGQRFQAAQESLKTARETAQDPVAASVTELVTQLGFFRISVDSNNYDGSQDADARTALDALAAECRGA